MGLRASVVMLALALAAFAGGILQVHPATAQDGDSEGRSSTAADQDGRARTPASPSPSADEASAVTADQVAAIARDLNCPICQGYNLQDCPHEACAEMRDLIRRRLEAGDDRDTIIAAFVADYGPSVLNVPPTQGFYAAAWILPVTALVAAGALVLAGLRRSVSRTRTTTAIDLPPARDAYRDRLERMLRSRDS
jgi:cytochrome c-type biogenesis protein CcmH